MNLSLVLSTFRLSIYRELFKSSTKFSSILLKKNISFAQQRNYCDLKVDLDLYSFLEKEIRSEKELNKLPKNGPGIPGFEIKFDGANVILNKKHNLENIIIKFNVNASVNDENDYNYDNELNEKHENEQEIHEMKSKPDFFIEIKKNNKTLSFSCSFLETTVEAEQEKLDSFEIQNFFFKKNSLISDQVEENVYLGDASIIDGQLYDLLMDYLDERGIGDEFAKNLIEFASYYEHNQYVNLLENLKNFLSNK